MSSYTIPPMPTPSTIPVSHQNVGDGNFEYIKNSHIRSMMQNGWQSVNRLELWDFMAKDYEKFGGYMYSNDKRVERIGMKMEELGAAHSGASFGCTMRNLQYLAQNGEDSFREEIVRDGH